MTAQVWMHDRKETVGTALTNTNTTACYTAPGPQSVSIAGIYIGNEAGSTKVALVYWYDASTTTAFFVGGFSIDDDRSQSFEPALRLDEDDEIRVKADNGVSVVVTVTPTLTPG